MRKNTKLAILRFFNAYGLKEYYMLLKYNKLSEKPVNKPMLISTVDNRRNCQGLTDRFKGIISVYALAKANDVPFRVLFTHPFELTDFLVPNSYDWVPKADELSDAVSDVRFKIMRKQPRLKRLLRMLPLKKQVRVYAANDYLEEVNVSYNQHFQWGKLFKELFKPTKALEDRLQFHLDRIGPAGYSACVFRFQSLLGDFKEYKFKSLPEGERMELIERNKQALGKLLENSDLPILVTSDSTTFIDAVKDMDRVYTMPGKVVHMDCTFDEQQDVYMKSFVDFLMLSNAKRIYSIGTEIMYPTNFPVYAAKINNIPFERIVID